MRLVASSSRFFRDKLQFYVLSPNDRLKLLYLRSRSFARRKFVARKVFQLCISESLRDVQNLARRARCATRVERFSNFHGYYRLSTAVSRVLNHVNKMASEDNHTRDTFVKFPLNVPTLSRATIVDVRARSELQRAS